jgi:hypothetical protein
MATTLEYSKHGDTFHVVNATRSAYILSSVFYNRIIDQDLVDAAALAKEQPGTVVTVSSRTSARGLKPRTATKHFVQ